MNHPSYRITEDCATSITIEDVGPWDKHPTVTNSAEVVVQALAKILAGRRLFYWDSEGEFGELVVKDGKFEGFRYVPTHIRGEGDPSRT